MLCERCKKNEATVHIKEFHGSTCETHHLCSECAKKKTPDISLDKLGFNLADVLFDVEKFAKSLQASDNNGQTAAADDLKCPNCNWSAAQIKKSGGRLGCPECYAAFKDLIKPAVAHTQRGSIHLGKRPSDAVKDHPVLKEAELAELLEKLQKHIANEEYEAAALCRDRINILKEQIAENDEMDNKK